MENTFINKTTLIVNSVMLLLLFALTLLINTNSVCSPPSFILNPENIALAHCNYTERNYLPPNDNLSSTHWINSTPIPILPATTLPVENEEENGALHSVDTAIFSFLIPLGLTSIVISLSNLWMTKLQQVKTVISLKRRYPIQIDTLKAVVVVVCLSLSAAYLTPFGLTLSNWSDQCQITPTLSLVSYITLLIVIAVFLCIDKCELSNDRKKHNRVEVDEPRNSKCCEKEEKNLFISLSLFLLEITVLVLLSMYLQIEHCKNDVFNVAISAIVFSSIALVLSLVLVLWNALGYKRYRQKKASQS